MHERIIRWSLVNVVFRFIHPEHTRSCFIVNAVFARLPLINERVEAGCKVVYHISASRFEVMGPLRYSSVID